MANHAEHWFEGNPTIEDITNLLEKFVEDYNLPLAIDIKAEGYVEEPNSFRYSIQLYDVDKQVYLNTWFHLNKPHIGKWNEQVMDLPEVNGDPEKFEDYIRKNNYEKSEYGIVDFRGACYEFRHGHGHSLGWWLEGVILDTFMTEFKFKIHNDHGIGEYQHEKHGTFEEYLDKKYSHSRFKDLLVWEELKFLREILPETYSHILPSKEKTSLIKRLAKNLDKSIRTIINGKKAIAKESLKKEENVNE